MHFLEQIIQAAEINDLERLNDNFLQDLSGKYKILSNNLYF